MSVEKGELHLSNDKLIQLGYLIKQNRMKNNMSMEALAQYVGISKGYMSEIESGKKRMKKYTIKKIFSELSMQYDIEETTYLDMENLLFLLYETIINGDKENSDSIIKKIKEKARVYTESLGFVDYCLSCLVYSVLYKEEENGITEILDHLSNCEGTLDRRRLAIYYDCVGLKSMNENNMISAKKNFIKALEQAPGIDILGVIYYHYCLFNLTSNNLFGAYIYSEQAYRYFREDCNHYGQQLIVMQQGVINVRFCRYKEAEKIFLGLIKGLEKYKIKNNYVYILDMLSWCYFKKKDYLKCISTVNKALENDSTSEFILFYKLFSYWKLKKYDICLKEIKSARERLPANGFHKFYLNAIYCGIINDIGECISNFEKCYRYVSRLRQHELMEFIGKLLVYEFVGINDINKRNYYLNELVKLKSTCY